ncbi:MAG: hypothetical protein V2A74_06450, partial [bacterium]
MILALGLVGEPSASAQTVTVDGATSNGVTTFSNLFGAVAAFHTGGVHRNNPAPNVINCSGVLSLVNGGPGTGPSAPKPGRLDISDIACSPSLTFNGPATIILDNAIGGVSGTDDDGCITPNFSAAAAIGRRDIIFNNITFLPETGTPDAEDGFQQSSGVADSKYDQLHVIFNDCVLTSNKGDNTPSLATGTGFANPGDKLIGDDWMYFGGEPGGIGVTIELNGTLVTHASDDGVIAAGPRLICRNTAHHRTRIIHNGGRGIQTFNSQMDMVGSPGRPIEISWNGASPSTADALGNAGIENVMPGSLTPHVLSYVDFIGNGEGVLWAGGAPQDAALNFDHCTFAFNRSNFRGGGIKNVSDIPALDTITACTFHDQQDNSATPVEEAVVWG